MSRTRKHKYQLGENLPLAFHATKNSKLQTFELLRRRIAINDFLSKFELLQTISVPLQRIRSSKHCNICIETVFPH